MSDQDPFAGFVESQDALFHYARLSTAIEKILPTGQLKPSRFCDTNDPREYKFLFLNLIGWSLPPETQPLYDAAHPVFDRIFRHQCKVLCFCSNLPTPINMPRDTERQIDIPQSPGWNKSRMWSQYGENHSGICLVFSREALHRKLAELDLPGGWHEAKQVTYRLHGRIGVNGYTLDGNLLCKQGVEAYCTNHIHLHVDDLFFTKDIDYRDESEFRIVVYDRNDTLQYLQIDDAVRGVIAGDRTSEVYFPLLKQLSAKFNAECRQVYWDRGEAHLLLFEKET